MPSLENRIAALEKTGSTVEGPQTIVIRGLTCGNLHVEIHTLRDSNGSQQWKRQPGETEQEFIDRASREVKRDRPGCALLLGGN